MKHWFFYLTLFALLGCTNSSDTTEVHHPVEYLIFEVKPEYIEKFITLENEIWTNGLKDQPGFVSKDIWINESNPGEISIIIYWEDFESWKGISKETLDPLIQSFDKKMGADNYKLIDEVHGRKRLIRVSSTQTRN